MWSENDYYLLSGRECTRFRRLVTDVVLTGVDLYAYEGVGVQKQHGLQDA